MLFTARVGRIVLTTALFHSYKNKVVSTELNNCSWCSNKSNNISKLMKRYFVQLALCDEWYRYVLIYLVGLNVFAVPNYNFTLFPPM